MRLIWLTSAKDAQAVELLRKALDAFPPSSGLDFSAICLACAPNSTMAARSIQLTAESREIPILSVPPPDADVRRAERLEAQFGEELWRVRYETQLVKAFEPFHPDMIMLAGYMLVAGEKLLGAYPMLNLHPALPGGPTGTRSDVIRQILHARPTEIGAMVHVVTADLDRGPAVAIVRIPVDHLTVSGSVWDLDSHDAFSAIEKAILDKEPTLVNAALRQALKYGGKMPSGPRSLEL